MRAGHDVLPHRHRGLLPARRRLPGARHLPRALDQARRHLRVRGHRPGARRRADYRLTTTFIRMLRRWVSQRIFQVPTLPNVWLNFPSVLKFDLVETFVLPGFLMATLCTSEPFHTQRTLSPLLISTRFGLKKLSFTFTSVVAANATGTRTTAIRSERAIRRI